MKRCSGWDSRAALAAAALVGIGFVARDAHAQTWSGGSASSNSWSIGANWVGGVAPVSSASTTITFAASPRPTSVQDIANPFQLVHLRILPGVGRFALSGQPLLWPATGFSELNIEQDDSSTATINNAIQFDRSLSIGGSGTGTLTLSGPITGAAGQTLSKFDALDVVFTNGSATNNIDRLNVAQGTFGIEGDGSLRLNSTSVAALTVGNSLSSPRLDILNGGRLNFAGGASSAIIDGQPGSSARVFFASFGTGAGGAPGLLNVGTTLTGRFDVVSSQVNVGTQIIVGNNGFSDGTLTMTGPGATLTTQRLVVATLANSEGTVTLTGPSCSLAASERIDLGGTGATSGGTATVNVSGGASVSTGTLTIFNNATVLTVNGSTLTVGRLINGAFSLPTVKLTNPTGGEALVVGTGGGSSSFGGVLADSPAGPGGLRIVGGGTLHLGNSGNTFTGGIDINNGWLRAGSDGALGAATNSLALSGGTLMLNASFSIATTRTVSLANDATSTFDTNGFSTSLKQGIVGNGTLSKQGAGTLTLAGNNSYVGGTNVAAGTLAVLAAEALVGPVTNAATISINESSSSTFSGSISGAGSLYKKGFGTSVLAGPLSYTGGTVIEGGTLAFGTNQSRPSLTVLGGAAAKLTPGGDKLLKVATTDFRTGFIVDLTDNDMIITGTSSLLLRTWIGNARNGGAWNGAGVQSSTAAADATHLTGIGYLTGAEFLSMNGATATFDGSPVVNSDGLAKFTWNGDASLDGRVTFDDYTRIDTGFNTHRTSWSNGDFNYSGAVNFDDYVLIDIAFNAQNGTLGRAVDWISGDDRSVSGRTEAGVAAVIEHLEQFGVGYGQAFLAAIPEPSALMVISAQAFACTVCPRVRRSGFNPNPRRVR